MERKPGKYDIKGNTEGLWGRETEHMLSRSTWPESLPRLLVQFVSGSIRYNGEIATEYPEILRYTASPGGKPTRLSTECPLCIEAQERNPGEDTKDHLFRKCPGTEKERVALKKALEVAVNEATKDNISQGAARKVATAVMTRPDYYAGQIDQAAKDIIDADNNDSGGWRDSKGEPLQIEHGKLQAAVLSNSLGIHCKRAQVLKRMQVKAGDHPTAHHGQYFLKQAFLNYEVAKLLRMGTLVTQIIPIRPPTQRSHP